MSTTHNHPQNGTSSALLNCEDAGEKLAAALSTYLQSCAFLETLSGAHDIHENNMVARIDISLKALHTKLVDDVSQSRVILARIHNKTSSRACSLPNEVLVEIFLNFVYIPAPGEARFPKMVDGLKRIFGRLHCLLAVCSTWRSVAMEFSELWSVIPVAESSSRSTPEAASLALQRSRAWTSGNRHLHLAAVLFDGRYSPITLFKDKGAPQFTSINIEARSSSAMHAISTLLEGLLGCQSSSILSELSIYQYHDPLNKSPRRRLDLHDYFGVHMSDQVRGLFTSLIESLSVFRLRNVHIPWNTITFSEKLVEFHLQSVVLGDHFKLAEFLHVLESAPELRDLKLISVVAFQDEFDLNATPDNISLPKLQSLLLADLAFNVLKHVLTSIAPGSHRIKVALTPRSLLNDGRSEDSDSEEYYDEDVYFAEGGIGSQPLRDLLESSNVDTIILNAGKHQPLWVDEDELRWLLGSLPSLKTLIMSEWYWDLRSIRALERPRSDKPFPNLTGLYILDGCISDAHLLLRVMMIASGPYDA
ncbi:unnamed protein product [Rhizoctonia solani]|uniref:F-box domain-containing protein n=1 Tax=Rhizoctonia solani TaxID=456999 RepID=A0A8H3BUT8_9AGAM|nr:unnamed protein product [Rhizoctonia solani]